MGLSIRAYSNITRVGNTPDDDDYDYNEFFIVHGNSVHFEERSTYELGLYSFGGTEHVWEGSYSYYNALRERLAEIAGYPSRTCAEYREPSHQIGACFCKGGVFWELLCFTDCEGILDAKTCTKLYNDFNTFNFPAAIDDSFTGWYNKMKQALLMASTGGCLVFD